MTHKYFSFQSSGLIVWLFFLLLGVTGHAVGQPTSVLEGYIQEGLLSNQGLRIKEMEILQARSQLRQSRALSKPFLTFDANYTLAGGGRKLDFPIGDLLNPVYSTLNALTQSNAFPTVENTRIQFLPNNFHETKLSFQYPIYNTDLRYLQEIREAELTGKSASKIAQERALQYDITLAYLQYLQTVEAEKVWLRTLETLTELKRFNESLVRNQVATRDVITTAAYEVSRVESKLFESKQQQLTAAAYFNLLLNADLKRPVQIDSSLLNQALPQYKLDDLLAGATGRRQELNAAQSFIQAAELNIKRNAANQKLPDFYLGGALGFQGFGYRFNSDQAYALAQLGMTYPIYDGGLQRQKTQESRIQSTLAQEQYQQARDLIQFEISAQYHALETAKFQYETAQKNVEAAQAIFKIVNNKYRNGQALLLEFLDAQNRVATAELQQVLAWTDILLKDAALKKAAGL